MNSQSLTPTEVAQDVLALLASKKLIGAQSGYFRLPSSGVLSIEDDVKSTFEKVIPLYPCKACAMGSMLLAITLKENQLTYGDLLFADYGLNYEMLLSVFSPHQLALIESAFENGYNSQLYTRVAKELKENAIEFLSGEDDFNTRHFNMSYPDAELRLIAIMENIIANNGIFIP